MNSLLKVFDNETFNSLYLNEMKLEISGTRVSAAVSVKKLGRLIESFDSRLNFIAGFLLNGLFLWDFHCIVRLEKWKSKYMERFPAWLKILGNVDAYTSLGNYAFNNPDFVYPVFSDSNIIFFARDLGHPLINDEMRVNNDFSLDNAGNICIISGANMAGKSTFLRTVAVNFILGMTGCPVCAAELVFTPMKIFTSMRTTDSLSSHESYFYAELKRLKTLKTKIAGDEPVFFILDEILKGTNSTDKSVGSKLFIEKLITHRGTGLIATHDISLGELEKDYPDRIFNMCFEIEIDGEAIKFDYKLNRGVTQKMNAALLMRQMGILD
jgi:DNA mismatch repair ATPase MutS